MRKTLLFVFLLSSFTYAGTGWFQDYLTISGTNFWIGSDPGSGTQLDGYNFGSVLTLEITSADMKYWSDTQDRVGGAFYWEVKDQSNTTSISGPHEVIWTQSYLGGNDYQGQWSGSIDILNGLSASTTYKLHIWAKSWSGATGQGDSWLSNNSNNYVATFTTDAGLPVELTTFTAFTKEKEVILNWETATEVNNYGFYVERASAPLSINSEMQWHEISFVEGHGNSNSPKTYSYLDNSVNSGKYKYRLKQVDIDGSFEYSETVEVNLEIPTEFKLAQNYPNPFNPVTTIKYSIPLLETLPETSSQNKHVLLKVFDVLGQEVATLVNKEQNAGTYEIEFDASELNSGIYIYSLQTSQSVINRKMILMK